MLLSSSYVYDNNTITDATLLTANALVNTTILFTRPALLQSTTVNFYIFSFLYLLSN